jgi:hypothetical protein
MLFLVKTSHALRQWSRNTLDVEGVLHDFLENTWHFCWAPQKYVLVASEEVDKLAFLFGVQTGPDLHSFGRVFDIDLHDLGVLGGLENARRRGHGRAERRCGYPKADLP